MVTVAPLPNFEIIRDLVPDLRPMFDAQLYRDKAEIEAIDRARGEKRPTLLEVETYRYRGHSMSDAVSGTYRSKEEVETYRERDPIVLLRDRMIAAANCSCVASSSTSRTVSWPRVEERGMTSDEI